MMTLRHTILTTFLTVFAMGHAPAATMAQQGTTAHDKGEMARIVQDWLNAPHGDYGALSFTYWNKDGTVPPDCAACHSQPGFLDFLGADGSEFGVIDHDAAINAPIGCASCHNEAAHELDRVTFPAGVSVGGLGSSAVCTVCHSGRQSGGDVDAAADGLDADTVSADLGFINIHYAVAAAVQAGSDVNGGYQYPGKDYAGTFGHVPSANSCTACHDPHSTQVETEGCLSCHRGVDTPRAIRTRHGDFDGDGDISGGIHDEIAGLHDQLYAAIQTYAAENIGAPIAYAPRQYPYFFSDADGDGRIGPDEGGFPNRYQSWTPRLLKAAYNYQMVRKDPGGYVHNPRYLLQLLHDSLEDLAQVIELDLSGRPRP